MQIRTLELGRLSEAAAVLGEAYEHEPIITRMIPLTTDRRRKRIANYFVWSMSYTGLRNVQVAVDPLSDRILGVALWEPPNHRPNRLASTLTTPLAFAAMGRHGFRVLDEFGEASEGRHPSEPSWHLVDIGTSAAARGLGVGTRLIEHRLREIDRARQIAWLEATTPASAKLYERFGFTTTSTLSGAAEGVSVMWREPQSA